MRETTIVVCVSRFDLDEKKLLELRGVGAGTSTFWYSNHSPQNLEFALSRPFDSSLKTAREHAL